MNLRPVGMAEMRRIFEVVDDLGLSRESIVVPLAPEGTGRVTRLPDGRFELVVPAEIALEEWLPTLRARLIELDPRLQD
ncbi:MAG TPA: hypothetical protein VJS92_00825 [Candidatus Polarisedimenticolaceae bacterium]|nr:hypothetical protein [Candidatus Polarisedimenticolaceae bacterium]